MGTGFDLKLGKALKLEARMDISWLQPSLASPSPYIVMSC